MTQIHLIISPNFFMYIFLSAVLDIGIFKKKIYEAMKQTCTYMTLSRVFLPFKWFWNHATQTDPVMKQISA